MRVIEQLPPQFARIERSALVVGGGAFTLCLLGAMRNPEQFLRAYLLAFIFCLTFPLGCMSIAMLHNLTGGWWGLPIRRSLEAGMRTLPLLAVFFVPLLLGFSHLYVWAQPAGAGALEGFKKTYLSPAFFVGRAVFYFAVWIVLAAALDRLSKKQDETGDPALALQMEAISGPGLILIGLTVTFSSVDWVMSLEPAWFSTIYGLIFMVVNALTAMAFVVVVARHLTNSKAFASVVVPSEFNDLGNLLLAFVMLWAYLSLSQFLIIWAGNLNDEISWYMSRAMGGWGKLAFFLILFHFFVPFFLLLLRDIKRSAAALSVVASALIVASLVDVFWLIVPAFSPSISAVHMRDIAMDTLTSVGLVGIWLWRFVRELRKRPLIPLNDPHFEGAMEHAD